MAQSNGSNLWPSSFPWSTCNHGDSCLNGSQVTQVFGFRLDWDWVSLELYPPYGKSGFCPVWSDLPSTVLKAGHGYTVLKVGQTINYRCLWAVRWQSPIQTLTTDYTCSLKPSGLTTEVSSWWGGNLQGSDHQLPWGEATCPVIHRRGKVKAVQSRLLEPRSFSLPGWL